MAAVKTRLTTCPKCGRSIGVRKDTGEIARHGPHGNTCAGSMMIPGDSVEFTNAQKDYVNRCWRRGDALGVSRMVGVPYPHCKIPVECANDADAMLAFLVQDARSWINQVVRDHHVSV